MSTSQEEDAVAARRSGVKSGSTGSPGKAKGGSAEKKESSFLAKAGESRNMGTKRLKRNDEDSPVRAEPAEPKPESKGKDQIASSGTASKGKQAAVSNFGSSSSNKKEAEVMAPLKDYDKLRIHSDPNFCPEKDSPQQKGQRMPLSFIVKALQLIE